MNIVTMQNGEKVNNWAVFYSDICTSESNLSLTSNFFGAKEFGNSEY